ncbi:MAG: BamA/TamA family outer membrane protein [Bacteroidota bacterium]
MSSLSAQRISGLSDEKVQAQLMRQVSGLKDSVALRESVQAWASEQRQAGWLECQLLGISAAKPSWHLQVYRGPQYRYRQVETPGLNALYRQKVELDRLERKQLPINWSQLEEQLAQCLELFQNEGYPFASFARSSLQYTQSGPDVILVDVSYAFDPGPPIQIDSISIQGNHREKDAFLHALMRISPGDPYNQKLIDGIPRLLNNSIYYQKVQTPKLQFYPNESAHLRVDLERKRSGKFDLLVGLQPPTDNTQRFGFTGVVDIVLVSPFRQGELVQFQLNRLTENSQQTQIKLELPYLLRSPVKVSGNLDILKQREDFLNLNADGALSYAINPFLSARFFYRNRSTRLLDSTLRDTAALRLNQLDGTRNSIGAGFVYEDVDYRNNPSKGVDLTLELGVGRRAIQPNGRFKEAVYENIALEQTTREIELQAKWYRKLFPRQVLHLANHTYWLGVDQPLRNDQLPIGGGRSIRGFNENQFFVNFMSFFSVEYRFQLERDSYLFLFGDAAYLEDAVADEIIRPLGMGLGMRYGTKAGIISIIYAVGRTNEIAFQPSRGKVHIGIVNQF